MTKWTGQPKSQFFLKIIFLLLIFFFTIFQIRNYDIWWHLKTGEQIIQTKSAPTEDIFSYTEPLEDWIHPSCSWLFDVFFFYLYSKGGINALIIAKSLIVLLTFIFIFKTIKLFLSFDSHSQKKEKGYHKIFYMILVWLMIVYFAGRFRFTVRPHIFSFLFISIYVYLLNRYRLKHDKSIFWLLPVQILWVNLHSSFIYGIFLPLFFFLSESLVDSFKEKKINLQSIKKNAPFLILFILNILGSLVNPYTFKTLIYPLQSLRQAKEVFNIISIEEWQRTPLREYFRWFGLILLIGMPSFLFKIKKIDFTDLFLSLGFLFLALNYVRNIPEFSIVIAPIAVRNFYPFFTTNKWMAKLSAKSIITAAIILLTLIIYIGVQSNEFQPGLGGNRFYYPDKAADFIKEANLPGNMFNSYTLGGYLIWKLYPEKKVFIDGRLHYKKDFLKEFVLAHESEEAWEEMVQKFDINFAVVEYRKKMMGKGLVDDKEKWALIYWDDVCMIFIRNLPLNQEIIEKYRYEYLKPNYFLDYYWRTHKEEGLVENLIADLKKKTETDTECLRARLLLGNIYLSSGEAYYEKAVDEYKKALTVEIYYGKAEVHNNLGAAYERLGRTKEALGEYKRAIKLDREYGLAYQNAGLLYLSQEEIFMGWYHLRKALKFIPEGKEADLLKDKLGRFKGYERVLLIRFICVVLLILIIGNQIRKILSNKR